MQNSNRRKEDYKQLLQTQRMLIQAVDDKRTQYLQKLMDDKRHCLDISDSESASPAKQMKFEDKQVLEIESLFTKLNKENEALEAELNEYFEEPEDENV